MKPGFTTKYQRLIQLMETFVSGQDKSVEIVRQIEVEFWACGLNEEDELSDLMVTLDLFGVPPDGFGTDTNDLARKCQYALEYLREKQ